jgi:hypothetical protein
MHVLLAELMGSIMTVAPALQEKKAPSKNLDGVKRRSQLCLALHKTARNVCRLMPNRLLYS